MNPRKNYTHLNNIVRSVNRRTGAHLSVKDARRIAKRESIQVKEKAFDSGKYPCVEGPLVRVLEAFLMEEAKTKEQNVDEMFGPTRAEALELLTDQDLADELRRRGYEVTATKTTIVAL